MKLQQLKFTQRWRAITLLAILLVSVNLHATVPAGEAGSAAKDQTEDFFFGSHGEERPVSRWALAFDNDMLVPSSRDQDYTYGVSLTLSGSRARSNNFSLHGAMDRINRRIGLFSGFDALPSHSIEVGFYGFTPEDISLEEANHDDRPYASLLYLSSSKTVLGDTPNTAWYSSLTIGVLGLDFVGELQNDVHRLTNSEEARGWDHQISDGGEPTARYSIARQRLWNISSPNLEIKSSVQASIGYLSEVSWSTSLRAGKLDTEWMSHNPELASYRERATQAQDSFFRNESYFSAGIALKARVYNVFLQGQFRHSDVSYDFDELNHGIVEAWVGYTHAFGSGYRLSYTLRGHTSEVREGAGDRNVLWGGLVLAKVF